MYYHNISSTQTDPLSTECLWSNSRTQTPHKAIAPHWSSSYPDYLSLDQTEGEQRRIVWLSLHDHRASLANRLARTRDRYLEARQALNARTTQVESSHDLLYRDILVVVTRDHTNDVGVCTHDDSGEACRNIPALVVSNDTGHVIGPSVVVEAYGRRRLSSSWRASRQQFSSIVNPHRNSRYSCSHMASLRPRTLLSSGSALLGWSQSVGHNADLGTGGQGTGRDLRVARYGRCRKGDVSMC